MRIYIQISISKSTQCSKNFKVAEPNMPARPCPCPSSRWCSYPAGRAGPSRATGRPRSPGARARTLPHEAPPPSRLRPAESPSTQKSAPSFSSELLARDVFFFSTIWHILLEIFISFQFISYSIHITPTAFLLLQNDPHHHPRLFPPTYYPFRVHEFALHSVPQRSPMPA